MSGRGLNWSEQDYAEWLNRQAPRKDNPAVCPPNLESASSDVAARKNEVKEVHPRVRITVHSRCRRLTDSSGRSHKAAIDGIVAGGLLPDDGPRIVASITDSQEQSEVEETIIEIWEIEE